MKRYRILLMAMLGLAVSAGVAGCDTDDGPAEQMGQALDDTGEDIQDAGRDAGNAVEDACEDVKEGVDADDTDC